MWVNQIDELALKSFRSEELERIILCKGETPYEIAPKGRYNPSLIKSLLKYDYDKIRVVDLSPKLIKIPVENIHTKDGVRIKALLDFSTSVKNEREILFRIAKNEEHEVKILESTIRQVFRRVLPSLLWSELIPLSVQTEDALIQGIQDQLRRNDICFSLPQIHEISFESINKELSNILENKQAISIKNELLEFEELSELERKIKTLDKKNELRKQLRTFEIEEQNHSLQLQWRQDFYTMNINKLKTISIQDTDIARIQTLANILKDDSNAIQIIDSGLAKALLFAKASIENKSNANLFDLLNVMVENTGENNFLNGALKREMTEAPSSVIQKILTHFLPAADDKDEKQSDNKAGGQ